MIYRGEHVTSFLSNPRLLGATVHALVIPNRHIIDPRHLTRVERWSLDVEIEILRAVMLGKLGLKGTDVWQKSRPDIAESAIKRDHVHWHVVGSQPGDQVYDTGIVWTPDRFATLSDEYAAQFLPTLQSCGHID
ncbi:MAG TPA: HIT domain-containing protein [Candidatus Saccharimonadales bacterium]|nr:HIT domain-containing protein [Candidatus Saccharimonadales bacterium]